MRFNKIFRILHLLSMLTRLTIGPSHTFRHINDLCFTKVYGDAPESPQKYHGLTTTPTHKSWVGLTFQLDKK
jgi:hypothetical protein